MTLAGFIEANKSKIVERWCKNAKKRLALTLDESALRDDLPDFIDDLVQALRTSSNQWLAIESAKSHGRHRMQVGLDIGGLTEEMTLVGETILELVEESDGTVATAEIVCLLRAVGRGAAASVRTYAALRDKQVADQTAEHFAFIAHEIRNPLQNARLSAQLLAGETSENRTSYLERLDRGLVQIADLIDNAIVRARLHGEPKLEPGIIDARELVEAACDNVRPHAEVRGLSIETEVAPFELEVDRRLIVSALTNLVSNAVKFTCKPGTVVVRARRSGDRAVFEIEDGCGGIPERLLPRLFEPFVQAGQDRSGFGLGLMIVKRAAESHGGSVRVFNRDGKGCCFVLELPQARAGGAGRVT